MWSMRLDGRDQRRVLGPPNGATDTNVSPNGKKLHYVAFNGLEFGQALCTADIDGHYVLQLTPFRFDVAIKQDWAPNGRHLVSPTMPASSTLATRRTSPPPGPKATVCAT